MRTTWHIVCVRAISFISQSAGVSWDIMVLQNNRAFNIFHIAATKNSRINKWLYILDGVNCKLLLGWQHTNTRTYSPVSNMYILSWKFITNLEPFHWNWKFIWTRAEFFQSREREWKISISSTLSLYYWYSIECNKWKNWVHVDDQYSY